MQRLKTIPFPETTFPRRESCQCCSRVNPCLVLRSGPPPAVLLESPAPRAPHSRGTERTEALTQPYLVLLLGTQTLPGPARAALRQSQSFCESCAALNHPRVLVAKPPVLVAKYKAVSGLVQLREAGSSFLEGKDHFQSSQLLPFCSSPEEPRSSSEQLCHADASKTWAVPNKQILYQNK